jgi:hypothetical protein
MGPDMCYPRVLKECANELKTPLQTIFNKKFEEGTLPEDWKVANITTLYKKTREANKNALTIALYPSHQSLVNCVKRL